MPVYRGWLEHNENICWGIKEDITGLHAEESNPLIARNSLNYEITIWICICCTFLYDLELHPMVCKDEEPIRFLHGSRSDR